MKCCGYNLEILSRYTVTLLFFSISFIIVSFFYSFCVVD